MARRKIALLVLLTVIGVFALLGVAGYSYLALMSRDAPDPASLGTAPEGAAEAPARAGEAAPARPTAADGTWTVAPLASNFVGYRIRERLGPVAAPSDAVSRTSDVDGSARIEGRRLTALDITIDPATLASESSHRDEFVRDEALEVERFPTAEFHLDEPVDVGAPERGRVIELAVAGQLTLRGQSNTVTFALQARWNGSTIQAAGSTTIRRSDFGIDVSGRAGFNIDEEGTIEFELTFTPADTTVGSTPPTLVDNRPPPTDEGEFRPPCQSDQQVRLTAPLLVTGATTDSTAIETVSGRGRLRSVHTTAGLTGGASWSPDGAEIVYSSSPSLQEPRTLFITPADDLAPTPIPGLSDVTHPDWGRDGRIAFVQWTGEDSDIWVVNHDGSDARRLVETPGIDTDPRWSPDGRSVVFTTGGGTDNQDVVVVDSDGRNLQTLAGRGGYEYAPSFTPDGDHVLFVRDGSIFTVGADGAGERRLTDGPSDTNPQMSPGGDQLALIRDGSLFVAAEDGSSPRCVVTAQAIIGGPRWRP